MTEENNLWEAVQIHSHEGWLELRDQDGRMAAGVRYDGCVNLRVYQDPQHDPQYVHLCFDDLVRVSMIAAEAATHWAKYPDRWNAWTSDEAT